MLGLTMHRATTDEATPREAAQKILDGVSELAAWAMFEVRNGVLVARHPAVTLGARVFKRLEAIFQGYKARIEADRLCEACGHAQKAGWKHTEVKHEAARPPERQTTIHLGPHTIEHHPIPGGIRVHPEPVINPGGNRHPRAAPRHH